MPHTRQVEKLRRPTHSLRVKTIFIVGGSAVTFLVFMYLFAGFLLWSGFSQLEQRDANTNIERLHNRINGELSTISSKVRDWASWDDAWEFMVTKNKTFATGNLDPNTTLQNLNADLLMYIGPKRELIAGLEWDPIHGKPVPLDQNILTTVLSEKFQNIWADLANPNFEMRGVVTISGVSWLMAERPVTKTDRSGEIRGSFLLGERITSKRIEAMADELQFDLAFQSRFSKGRKNATKYKWSSINIGVPFQNFDATPAFSIRIQFDRDVMQQGRLTLSSMLASITAACLAIAFLILSLLDRRILKRIEKLKQGAQKITSTGSTQKLLQDTGNDEIKDLTNSINAMVSALDHRNEEIRDIIENVRFGFFLSDLSGVAQRGYTASSTSLLNSKKISGTPLGQILNFSAEQNQLLDLTLTQLQEDIIPDDITLNQLPKRVMINDKTISVETALIRDRYGKPNRILVSIVDVSILDLTERENRANHTLIAILRGKQAFASLIDDLSTRQPLFEVMATTGAMHQLRQELHTLNGNLRCFEIWDLVNVVAAVENEKEITITHVQTLFKNIEDWINKTRVITGVPWRQPDENVTWDVSEQFVTQIEGFDINAASVDELNAFKSRLVREIRTKSVQELESTFESLAAGVAAKLGKTVKLFFVGTNMRVSPSIFQILADIIPHTLRNAVDHGIEPTEARLTLNKQNWGKITVGIDAALELVIRISISDDGAGIDLKVLSSKALQAGLTDEESLKKMTEEEKLRFILHPNLSTKDQVEEISGRGYGMAAVRERVEDELRGRISITSILGKGTTIVIEIPKEHRQTGQAPAIKMAI